MEKALRTTIIEEYMDRIEINGEVWDRRSIEKANTGHVYRGNALETSSDCGNCDGGNCDWCETVWEVTEGIVPNRPFFKTTLFRDEEKAMAYYNAI